MNEKMLQDGKNDGADSRTSEDLKLEQLVGIDSSFPHAIQIMNEAIIVLRMYISSHLFILYRIAVDEEPILGTSGGRI